MIISTLKRRKNKPKKNIKEQALFIEYFYKINFEKCPMTNPFEKIPNLDEGKIAKLLHFSQLLREANERVNLLSRKDMEDVEYRHVAFCAAMSAFFQPSAGARIADVGSGGGLPGIVMAILYPQAKISMFDGVGKKMAVVNEMCQKLSLKNAVGFHARIEEQKGMFDYCTGRAVCALPMFFGFVKNKLAFGKKGSLENGVIYFKGGELEDELQRRKILPDAKLDLEKFFEDTRFEGKKLVHFKARDVVKC